MATREELIEALKKAKAAGDRPAQVAIARRLESMDSAPAAQPPEQSKPKEGPGVIDRIGDFTYRNIIEPTAGLIESGTQLASAAIAEPVAGIAGLASSPFVGGEEAANIVQKTREALTYKPQTESAKALSSGAGELLEPFGRAISKAETFLGEKVLEKTDSPALAAAAHTLPTAVLELIGYKLGKQAAKAKPAREAASSASKAQHEALRAAPSAEALKEVSRQVYKEIDDLGATVKPEAMQSLTNRIRKVLSDEVATPELNPKATGVLKAFERRAKAGQPVRVSELDKLRQVAREAATQLEPGELRLTGMIVDEIDDFLDKAGVQAIDAPKGAKIGERYKVARDLYGRAKKSEMVSEAIDKAQRSSTSFNSALKNEINRIINSKKKMKYFTEAEKGALRKIVEQPAMQNLAEFVGKFGFETSGPSSHFLGGSIGTTFGAVAGSALAGPPGAAIGAALVPGAGTLARKLAAKMRAGRAKMADEMIRAGYDAKKITETYLKNVPKASRSAEELSLLLMDPGVSLAKIPVENELVKRAAQLASEQRAQLAGALAAGAAPREEDQQ